jgi:DNA-binding MarR family transcriptional regulator
MKELAEFSAVDRTTMTRTVDQLVAANLVQRATPSTDRRQVVLTATAEGHTTFRGALKVIYRLNLSALEGVPEDMQRTLARAQQAVLANLGTDLDQTERLMRFRRGDRSR